MINFFLHLKNSTKRNILNLYLSSTQLLLKGKHFISHKELVVQRMSYLYFLVGTASLLDALYKPPFDTTNIIQWVYNQQNQKGGFRCGPIMGLSQTDHHNNDYSNLASTYSALCILKMCGDNLSRVNVVGIQNLLKELNIEGYKIRSMPYESEDDVRFAYCGISIAKIINSMSILNTKSISQEIALYQAYDGGFSWCKYGESHAGITYCALASLNLMETLGSINQESAFDWLTMRFNDGWSGRVGKYPDSCYGFWNVASIYNLNKSCMIDDSATEEFIIAHQKPKGGFGKYSLNDIPPDIVHTFYSLSTLSLIK